MRWESLGFCNSNAPGWVIDLFCFVLFYSMFRIQMDCGVNLSTTFWPLLVAQEVSPPPEGEGSQ